MLNRTILQGRLCADPEMRRTQSGVAVCSFRVAWSEKYKDHETKLFLSCVAWRTTAEMICKYFRKGKEILVEGQLTNRDYEAKDGGKRTVTEMTVERVHFCGPKEEAAGGFRPAGSAVSVEAEDFTEVDEQDDLPF